MPLSKARASVILLAVFSSCPMVMVETRGRLTFVGDAEDCQKCLDDQVEALRALERENDRPPEPPAPLHEDQP